MIKRTRKSGAPTFDEISRRAYEIFVQRGRPNGQDLEHWLQAETELKSAPASLIVARVGRGLRRDAAREKRLESSARKPARQGRSRRG